MANNTIETYSVNSKCNNCGSDGPHEISKGTLISDATCDNCGCKTLGTKPFNLNALTGGGKINDYEPRYPKYPYMPMYTGDDLRKNVVLC